ncbi:hypothetical protein BJ546DRAFT_818385, partial [Cryomyces antarcticus]
GAAESSSAVSIATSTGRGIFPPSPVGPGTASSYTTASPSIPHNETSKCGGCTVNVPNAGLKWWWTATYYYAISTFSLQFDANDTQTGWALLSPRTAFNVTDAMLQPTYSTSMIWNSYINSSMVDYQYYSTPTPVAAATTVVTVSAVRPSQSLVSCSAMSSPRFLICYLQLVILSLLLSSSLTANRTSTTPFVYYTAYALETQLPYTFKNGSVQCLTQTQTYNLSSPFAFDYSGDSLDGFTHVSGDVPGQFVDQIPQASCIVGTWQADPTVMVVVDLIYAAEAQRPRVSPFVAHLESSAITLYANPTDGVTAITTTVDGRQLGSGDSASGQRPTNAPQSPQQSGQVSPSVGSAQQSGVGSGQGSNNQPNPAPAPVVVIDSSTITVGLSSYLIVGSQTVYPGAPAITISGTPVSLGPSAVVVGGSSAAIPQAPAPAPVATPPLLTIGANTYTANAATQYYLAPGQTLTAGGQATVSGTVVSLGTSASYVVVNGVTRGLSAPTVAPQPLLNIGGTHPAAIISAPILTVRGRTYTANAGFSYVIGGQTLTPGGMITVSGTTISLAPSAANIVVNGVTQTLASPATVTAPPVLTIGGTTYTANTDTTYTIAGQTLTPGGVVTVSGTVISLTPSATAIVLNGVTSALFPAGVVTTSAPLLTVGASTYTANAGTSFTIGGQTLTPG